MNVKKRIKYIITALFAFVVAIIISGQGFLSAFLQPKYVYASDEKFQSYDETDIKTDLEEFKIDTTKTYSDVTLLYFLEYGYGYESIYSIYLYTYIPLGQTSVTEIIYDSKYNSIAFGFTDNKENVLRVDYHKLTMYTKTIKEENAKISDSVSWFLYKEDNSGVFVKWKVDLMSNNFILSGCANRYYCVSGIELHEKRKRQ